MTGADQGVDIISNTKILTPYRVLLQAVCTTVVQSSSVMGSSNSRPEAIKSL